MMLRLNDILSQPPAFDVFAVYRAGDPCADLIGPGPLRRIYEVKHQVAAAVRPQRVFEIGVRAGYAAAAFLTACPSGRYLGVDKDDGSHGGTRGYAAWAGAMLLERYPAAWIEVWPWDSGEPAVRRRLVSHWAATFDLLHVDGEHTVAGCGRDLVLADALARPGGYLLVDDYDLIPEVRSAAEAFLAERRGRGYEALAIPSPHGELLIRKASDGEW